MAIEIRVDIISTSEFPEYYVIKNETHIGSFLKINSGKYVYCQYGGEHEGEYSEVTEEEMFQIYGSLSLINNFK